MAQKTYSGNRGEWSEPYVVLRLLADGKLYQADKDLLPSATEYADVMEVIRSDTRASIEAGGVVVFAHADFFGQQHTVHTDQTHLLAQAKRLFKAICSASDKKGAFELPSEAEELRLFGFKNLTNPAPAKQRAAKRDLQLRLKSLKMGTTLPLGFSVKSEIGMPPTLLNASEPTNIVYRVKGLTEAQAKAINDIGGSRKIMDRCRAIKQSATAIQFEKYHCHIFADNLEIVDSSLPEMVADLVKTHYFEQILMPRPSKKSGGFREADRLSAAVEMMSHEPPYCEKARKNFCEVKIKRFLRACALGMMPSDVWDGREDASGGYIIVLPDGRLVALYVYNTNLFEKYLFETTIFERASTTRHKYLTLVPDGDTGDYLLKLNLQIRFSR